MVSTSLAKRGRGRPPGAKNKATLEKAAVIEAFNQRVLNQADALFNAQFKLATGSQIVFRIDVEKGKQGGIKETHVQVTNPQEIKELLDAHGGDDGSVDGNYYYFQTIPPDNKAIDSLLNRTFGKAKETMEIEAKLNVNGEDQNSPEFKCRRFIDTVLDIEKNGKRLSLDEAYEVLLSAEMGVEESIKVRFVEGLRGVKQIG
jgi:hypothetical protein